MELNLKRVSKTNNYTIGQLYINGKYECDTLEDTDRDLTSSMSLEEIKSKKIYGNTAIPKGIYKITLDIVSPKFKDRVWAKFCNGKLPRLLDVKGYDGVLIHVGNKVGDTLGCILVGKNTSNGVISNSTITFKKLYSYLLVAKEKGDKLTIKIE
jgi:hypothetical protein